MKKRRVYIANTGGTIGMRPGPDGYRNAVGFLREVLEALPELHGTDMPEVVLHDYDPLLDSANMSPANWEMIAADIIARYDDFDGFVIIHGTDTITYTASALSFLLEGLSKPVVLTGAQIPLCQVRSDGRPNLIDAILIAAHEPIPEVCVVFADRILRGNRAVKISADDLDAYRSPNFPPLGRAGTSIEIDHGLVRSVSQSPLRRHQLQHAHVAALQLFPGITGAIVRNATQAPLQGLLVLAYGSGNGPADADDLIDAIEDACQRGVVVVIGSQCAEATVQLGQYATSGAFGRAGAVGVGDMTPEAALTKLYYLLALGLSAEEVRTIMPLNLRGEVTGPEHELPLRE